MLAFDQTVRWMKTKDGKSCRAVQASAVRDADGSIIVKAVNCSENPQPLKISLAGAKISSAKKIWFTGPGGKACNNPLDREALKEASGTAAVKAGIVDETLPPLSLNVFKLTR